MMSFALRHCCSSHDMKKPSDFGALILSTFTMQAFNQLLLRYIFLL